MWRVGRAGVFWGSFPQGFRPPSRPTLSFRGFAVLPICRFAAAVCSGSDRIPVLRVFYTGYIYIPCKNGKTGNPDRCRDRQTDGFAVLRGEAANRQNDGFLSQPAFSAICGPTAELRALVLRADPQNGKTMKS
jgi:hypothetical protein